MVDKTPVRVVFDSSNVATGLGEFQTGETVPLANGGTGSALTIGTANQVLRVNSDRSGLEFVDAGDIDIIASSDSTGVQVQDDLNVSGTLSVNVLDVNEISSGDSTAITIKDDLMLAGTLRAEDSGTLSIDGAIGVSGTITSGSITTTGTITTTNISLNQIEANDSSSVSVTSPLQLSETLQVAGVVTSNSTPTENNHLTTISYVSDNFAKSGFPNSTVGTFPLSDDSSATDFHEGSDGVGSLTVADAFGVALTTRFDCMEPIGSTATTNLGSGESHVGA